MGFMICWVRNSAAMATAAMLVFSAGEAHALATQSPTEQTTKTATATLRQELKRVVDARETSGVAAIHVIDIATSTVIFSHEAEVPVAPASCNKLFTTAAALKILGPDYRLRTVLRATGTTDSAGVLKGDLIVEGQGDPTISGRFETDKRNVVARMQKFAAELRAHGITRVSGSVVADSRMFDDVGFHPDWGKGERGEWYSAEVWALSFNDNCVDFTWSGAGLLPDSRANYTTNPLTNYVTLENNVKVVARGRGTTRNYRRAPQSNDIRVDGRVAVEETREDSAAIHNGALYFATVMTETLETSGIQIDGKPRLFSAADAPKVAKPLLTFTQQSPRMAEIVNVINRNSQNFYAECLLKYLGLVTEANLRNHREPEAARQRGGVGTFENGALVIEKFVKTRLGVFSRHQDMRDGSGLASTNRTTARQLAELMAYMAVDADVRGAWRESLPIGGVRGTLRARFQQTSETKTLARRISGKTGLIGGVRSLTGIATTASGRELAFSVVLNRFGVPEAQAIALIDKVALTLAASDFARP